MKRWQKLALLAAAVIVPGLSCGQRSLVLIDVKASNTFEDPSVLGDVGISVTANRDVTTRFSHAHLLAGGTYQIGMYLPSDMTGTVTFVAEVDNGDCVFATGMATATGVQSGETTRAIDLVVMPTAQCTPIRDGGAGASGTAGTTGTAGIGGVAGTGSPGSGGTGGTGVVGTGGVIIGTAGSGVGGVTAGAAGRGGTTGTAGIGGMTAGAAGRGGTTGTGGAGGMLTGTAGRGGTVGTGGIGGMQGTAGFGGSGGVGGAGGAAGRGGFGGSAGMGGTGGSAGMGGAVGGGPGVGGVGGGAGGPGVGGSSVGGSSVGGAGGGTGCGTTACVPPYVCNGSGACVCSESSAQACARAGIACGYVLDNCGQQVFCSCKIAGQICDTVNDICMSGCTTGTGGIVTTDMICPL
jgi:hypothetical protein